jgi:hypothetical protein
MLRTRRVQTPAKGIALSLLFLGLLVATPGETAAQAPPLAMVGEIPMGTVDRVAVAGDLAIAALGPRLLSLSLAADGQMRTIDATAPLAAPIHDLALSGSTALVAADGLYVVDVSDPTRLLVRARLDVVARGVVMDGSRAVVIGDALHVVDLASPGTPGLVGTLAVAGDALVVDGAAGRAYVAAGLDGVRLVDLADPAAPSVLGQFDDTYATGVAAASGFAFVADPDVGVRVIDWRDADTPVEVATFPAPGDTCSGSRVCPYTKLVTLVGSRLFVGYERGSGAFDSRDPALVLTLDVSDPAAPREVARTSLRGTPTDLAPVRDGLLVAERPLWWYAGIAPCQMEGGGLLRMDEALALQERLAPPIAANALHVEGRRLLMADVTPQRTRAYDLADPGSPSPLERPSWREFGSRYGSAEARDLALVDGQLSVAIGSQTMGFLALGAGGAGGASGESSGGSTGAGGGTFGWRSASAAAPSATLLNGCSPPPADQRFERIEALGADAALLDANGYLSIHSAPNNRLGSYDDFVATDLAIAGDQVHLVGQTGYHIVDASDRTWPVLLGSLPTAGRAIALRDDRAYVGAADGVHVIDISRPAAPTEIGVALTDGEVDVLLVAGRHIYVAAGGTLRALGGEDATLAEVARAAAPTDVRRVVAAGEHIFTTDAGGVSILALLEGDRVEPPVVPEPGVVYLPIGLRGSPLR